MAQKVCSNKGEFESLQEMPSLWIGGLLGMAIARKGLNVISQI